MARPRLGDSESKRLQMVITEDEVKAIDTWQHDNHIASRSEAIRRLAQIAIENERAMSPLNDAVMDMWNSVIHQAEKISGLMKASSADDGTVKLTEELIDASIQALVEWIPLAQEVLKKAASFRNVSDGLSDPRLEVTETLDFLKRINDERSGDDKSEISEDGE